MESILEDNRRLKIVVYVLKEDRSFTSIKKKFNLTDGNLYSHLKKLQNNKIIEIIKDQITQIRITKKGRVELEEYVKHLKAIIEST